MDKRALSAIPRPVLTDKNKEMLLLVPNMSYLATATRQEISGIDTLIINFFHAEKKDLKPAFRTFCQPEDYITQDLTVDKTKWKTGAINYLTGYLYWYRNGGNIVMASVEERETILGFLYDFKKRNGVKDYQRIMSQGRSVVDTEVEDRIDEYQDTIKEWKLEKRHQKEKDFIDGRMAKFGALPEDYDAFIAETVFREDNYIFYSLPKKTAYCSKCKHDFLIDGEKHLYGDKHLPIRNKRDEVKHNRAVMCPWCNTFFHCKSEGMSRQSLTAIRWSVLIQKDGEDVLVRYFRHIKDFQKDFRKPKIETWEAFRTIHTAEKAEDYEWNRFKMTQERRWCIFKDRSYGYCQPSEYAVPRQTVLYNQNLQEAVSDTCMKYSSIDLYVKHVLETGEGRSKAWFVDWYFNAYRKDPLLEQLLKVGFYKMAKEFLEDHDAPKLKTERTVLGSLGISKIQFNMLRKVGDPSFRDLEILKYKPELTWDDFTELRYIHDNGYDKMYRKYADFMEYTTLHKLKRYIAEQKIHYENDYFDYAKWTEEMGYDMRNSFNLFPRDFIEAHNARSREYIKFKDREEREAQKRFNMLLKKLQKETADVEAMNLHIGGLFIRLPNRIEELKTEGEVLHHCVGTYQEKVRKGETMIFFIRQEAEPDKSFYTLEWRGKVVQCRGLHNCDMTVEVKAFVKIFEKKMLEYESTPVKKHRKVG